ncbi:hypothetical protein PVAG01_01924 [Phlyctema vagabunda]|uniref:Uncharacterized protein n=1 Tax=Phlyctema vagabunda TaxID=108571 RepID=A0ABR4PYH4_9HELO
MDVKDRHDHVRAGAYLLRPRTRLLRSVMLNRRVHLALLLTGLFLTFLPWSEDSGALRSLFSSSGYGSPERKLHLLIPATSSNPNFCRTTLSAALLDYPSPVLVNWEGKEDSENPYASHLAKIERTLEYLRGLPARNDKDLALIVDGYDVWFQLRPEVLIQRYYAAVEQSAARLAKEFNSGVLAEHDIKQTVFFGADKKCWPQGMEYPACYAAPESSLPGDMFGKQTDAEGEHKLARPRWLNSGTVLGPVSEVRAIFEASSRRVLEHPHGYSDQWYFSELFGDQEYRRNSLSKRPRRLDKAVVNTKQLKRATTPSKASRIMPEIKAYQQTEFHMGLDYDASLFHTNAFADDDTEWMLFNSTKTTTHFLKSNYAKYHSSKGASPRIPSDILNSRPPISKSVIEEELFEDIDLGFKELPYNTTWNGVPLLVNTATGSVPVIIHLNGKKERLDDWWQQLWWAKNGWGRHLLRSGSRAPRGPLGVTTDPETGKPIAWYKGAYNSLRRENGGYWSSKGEWLYYKHLCGPHEKVLFEGRRVGVPERQEVGWKGPAEGKGKAAKGAAVGGGKKPKKGKGPKGQKSKAGEKVTKEPKGEVGEPETSTSGTEKEKEQSPDDHIEALPAPKVTEGKFSNGTVTATSNPKGDS